MALIRAGSELVTPAFSDVGSTVYRVLPDIVGPDFSAKILEAVGVGVVLVSGAANNHRDNSRRAEITFLTARESGYADDFRDTRTFRDTEIYDGAALPGQFQRIVIRWRSTTVTEPLVLRILHPGPNRVVPVAAYLASGLTAEIVDFGDGTTWSYLAAGQVAVYNDNNPFPFGTGSTPVAGDGVGDDFELGRHRSARRRLHFWAASSTVGANFTVVVSTFIGTGTTPIQLYQFNSVLRAAIGTIGAQATVDLAGRAGATDGGGTAPNAAQGLVVPGKIAIHIVDAIASAASGNAWIQFLPV